MMGTTAGWQSLPSKPLKATKLQLPFMMPQGKPSTREGVLFHVKRVNVDVHLKIGIKPNLGGSDFFDPFKIPVHACFILVLCVY